MSARRRATRLAALLLLAAAACAGRDERPAATAPQLAAAAWDSVEARARGTTVTWRATD